MSTFIHKDQEIYPSNTLFNKDNDNILNLEMTQRVGTKNKSSD